MNNEQHQALEHACAALRHACTYERPGLWWRLHIDDAAKTLQEAGLVEIGNQVEAIETPAEVAQAVLMLEDINLPASDK